MRKWSFFLFFMLILTANAFGAIIQGTIYDMSLDELKDVLVEINTEPKQKIVAKEGLYSFNVPEGTYIITATQKDDLETTENITVSAEGDFILDLILLPVFDEAFLEETEFELGEEYEELLEDSEKSSKLDKIVIIALIVLCFIVVIWVAMRNKKKKKKEKKEMLKEDKEKTLAFLKKQGGRALQKDIRKHLAVSEAKASLLIDELTAKGKVEKIKKGRGNIIILK